MIYYTVIVVGTTLILLLIFRFICHRNNLFNVKIIRIISIFNVRITRLDSILDRSHYVIFLSEDSATAFKGLARTQF